MRTFGTIVGWIAQALGYLVGGLGVILFLLPTLSTLVHPKSTMAQSASLLILIALLAYVAYSRLSFWQYPYRVSGVLILAAVPVMLLGSVGSNSAAVKEGGGWNDLIFFGFSFAGAALALIGGVLGLLSGYLRSFNSER